MPGVLWVVVIVAVLAVVFAIWQDEDDRKAGRR